MRGLWYELDALPFIVFAIRRYCRILFTAKHLKIYSPKSIIMLKNGMESVNDSICEAAQIDGAGHVRILVQIMLPLTTSFIATVVLFNAIGH